MENQVVTIEKNSLVFEPQNITKETVKRYICPQANDQEIIFFLQICKTFNLNPLKREIYLVKYGEEKANILVGYEVYLKRAERSNKWGGMEVKTEGTTKEGNLKAIVKIFRKDWKDPLIHEADYSEYVQNKKDGTPNRFWATKPKTMIKKVAISQAFRFAFPDEFDGMPYTSDEVVDQEKVVDITKTLEEPPKPIDVTPEVIKEKTDKLKKEAEIEKKILLMHKSFEIIKPKLTDEQWKEVLEKYKLTQWEFEDLKDIEVGSMIYKDMRVIVDGKT